MDAMDVDWCLTCSKQTSHGKPYCSKACKRGGAECADVYPGEFSYISDDASSSSDALRDITSLPHIQRPHSSSHRHTTRSSQLRSERRTPRKERTREHAPQQQPFLDAELEALTKWPGYSNEAGIRAWASAIPANSTVIEPESVGLSLPHTHVRPEFPLSQQRPARPALCTDTTQPARATARSSSPISLPSPRGGHGAVQGSLSVSSYSLVSALTESFATPASVRPRHTKTQVAADKPERPNVLEGLARRFRSWGTSTGPTKLMPDSPAEIFMQTTKTTVPATPSPDSPISPIHRSNTAKKSNPKTSASGFTVRVDEHSVERDDFKDPSPAVFELRLPLKAGRSPLAYGDAEIKATLQSEVDATAKDRQKRGIWIAGREKAEKGWAGFGPAYYEKDYRACLSMSVNEKEDRRMVNDREFREFEAWNARGRKATRR